ncbi:dienelactone hydrolase family protein [Lineolata rhizophorae]|uniref:Dienelactone hydrolase family protein n=1 Tax=Lineolata rhizophorae TaxID=578093 RepID=A0A6A6P0A4_9PEZI|nr:dienelactone hydrolase family protein [Lineolata rhizophorae]
MASHPPGQCCIVGVKHEGQATGEMKTIGDNISTYFAYPKDKSTQNAILILTDGMGHGVINSQLIADQLAANGYFVVMPDLFYGDPAVMNAPGFDIYAWLPKHGPETVDPVVEAALKHMRGPLGCKSVGGVGYCFGAKYVARNLKAGRVDAGYIAHPSLLTLEELRAIEGPLSIAAAETDETFPPEMRHESEAALKDVGVAYQINLYSGVEHGFAARGDVSKRLVKFAKEQAFLQAVAWFDEWIKS